MGSNYFSIIAQSAQATVDLLIEFHQQNSIALLNFNRQVYGPGEHHVEIWYLNSSDAGYAVSYSYFRGPSADFVTAQAVTFYNTGAFGYGYFNRQVLSPSDHLFEIWAAPVADCGVTGGFVSFKGRNYFDTVSQMNQFVQDNTVTEENAQRTVLSPGSHILDFMWFA
jgi:hypothetical protein